MAFMMPPKAETQIIMTMTQPPASEKPLYSSSLSQTSRCVVPAQAPRMSEEIMPAPRQSSVWTPRKLMTMTSSMGTII